MSEIADALPLCQGEMHLTADGALEGWCWYPDQPNERATVELMVDGNVLRAARATRLQISRRDLGLGDGYCGFAFPLPGAIHAEGARTVVEIRERKFGQVLGRLVLGTSDKAMQQRLDAIASSLATTSRGVDAALRSLRMAAPMEEFGATLLHLASRPSERVNGAIPGLAACLEHVAALPACNLGWSALPLLSVVVPPPERDVADVAASLRDAGRALEDVSAEFLLLDDGALPLCALLPVRLRNLQLVRIAPKTDPGGGLNVAAAIARGSFLAFARPGGPSPAGLAQAARAARRGVLGLGVTAIDEIVAAPHELHRLQCIVSRNEFAEIGGFDATLAPDEMWRDLADKAVALGMRIHRWAAPRPMRDLTRRAQDA